MNDLCLWVQKLRGDRTVKVRIDKTDTWSMDSTLAHIILPMLKQLRDTKHGSPMVDDEDVPPHMRHSNPDPECFGADNWVHYKWEWVLNEMIFAFESIVDDSWEDKFYHGDPSYIYVPVNPKEEYTSVSSNLEDAMESDWVRMEQTNPDFWVDYEGIKELKILMKVSVRIQCAVS